MTKQMITEFNAETGETIEREMTENEIILFQTVEAEKLKQETEEANKAAKKAELLAKLGITEDDAKLLLS